MVDKNSVDNRHVTETGHPLPITAGASADLAAATAAADRRGDGPAPRFATGGDALAESLIAQGVDTIFGIPGVQLDPACDALYYRKDCLRYICARNEQAVTYMADGYSRSTGRVGVGMVVPGPGLLNALAGLATAYSTNSRVLLICGQVPTRQIGKMDGVLHELPDQTAVFSTLCKWHAMPHSAAEIPGLVEEAFRQLRSGRPQPVVLEMPPDVLASPIDASARIAQFVMPSPMIPEAASVEAAARMIGDARRPLLYAGGGVRAAEASGELTELAHRLGAPVVVTEEGRGDIDCDDPLAFDQLAFRTLRSEADLIVAVGTRFTAPQGGVINTEGTPYICINADEHDLREPRRPQLAVLGDARLALRGILDALDAQGGADGTRKDAESRSAWGDAVDAAHEWTAAKERQLAPQRAYLDVIGRALGRDGVFVSEYTQVGYAAAVCMPRHTPFSYIGPGYEGTLGYGFATALGVQAADSDRRVVAVSGDGGFSWTMPELSTMKRYELPLVCIIFNDGFYGNVRRIQRNDYGGRYFSSDLTNPDYMTLAQAFGLDRARVYSPEELDGVLSAALAARTPMIVEVPVGEFPTPWNLVHEGLPDPAPLPEGTDRVHPGR